MWILYTGFNVPSLSSQVKLQSEFNKRILIIINNKYRSCHWYIIYITIFFQVINNL